MSVKNSQLKIIKWILLGMRYVVREAAGTNVGQTRTLLGFWVEGFAVHMCDNFHRIGWKTFSPLLV